MSAEDAQAYRELRKAAHDEAIVLNDFDIVANILLPEEYRYDCLAILTVRWDQWAEATLTCVHGEYAATSDFLNITEAIFRASIEFRKQHPLDKGDHGDVRYAAWKRETALKEVSEIGEEIGD